MLVYVFGGDGARGDVVQNPYTSGSGVYVVLRPADAPTGEWLSESVDLAADYRAAFGDDAGILVGVAVASDSDDTGGRNVAALSEMVLR